MNLFSWVPQTMFVSIHPGICIPQHDDVNSYWLVVPCKSQTCTHLHVWDLLAHRPLPTCPGQQWQQYPLYWERPKQAKDTVASPMPSVDLFHPLTFSFSVSFITNAHEKWVLNTCYTPGYFNLILCLEMCAFIVPTRFFFFTLVLGNLT